MPQRILIMLSPGIAIDPLKNIHLLIHLKIVEWDGFVIEKICKGAVLFILLGLRFLSSEFFNLADQNLQH